MEFSRLLTEFSNIFPILLAMLYYSKTKALILHGNNGVITMQYQRFYTAISTLLQRIVFQTVTKANSDNLPFPDFFIAISSVY